MFHKMMLFLVVAICLTLVIPALNCAPQPQLGLKLDKAPRLNEPVEISCLRTIHIHGGSDNVTTKTFLTLYRIDPKTRHVVDVPLQDVLVGDSLNWEAAIKYDKPTNRVEVSPQNVLATDSMNFEKAASKGIPLKFSATVKFPYEGNWGICARQSLEAGPSDCVYLYVAEDESMFGWLKDYAPPVDPYPRTPNEQQPITVELDILKPPRLDEPFQITWTISTIRDIPEASGEVEFYYMEGTKEISAPVEEVLIKGDVTWKGLLKKDNPLHFSAIVKLPKEGDWRIRAVGIDPAQLVPRNAGFSLFLHVGKDKGRWGWTESHEDTYKGPPPPEVELPPTEVDR